ncbi:MAG: histidine kinase [Bacteroidota bacterium]
MPKITQNSTLFPETTAIKFSDVLTYYCESLLDIEDEEAILWDLAKNCISKLGFIDCVVYLLDEKRGVMIQKAAYGPKNPKNFEIYEPVERPLGFGIVGHVAQSGNAELIHDASKDERYEPDDEFRYSEVCVPIIIDGTVIGIIDCEHPEKFFFSEHHLHMLLTMSSITALKLKSVRAHIKYINEQKKANKIQQQLVDLKLQAFSTQMNPHFVFNALNAIQFFITSGDKKSALDYLSAFAKLIRFNLAHLGRDSVVVEKEIAVLGLYLKLQKLRYDNQFDFSIENELSVHQRKAHIPSLVIQTLIENSIEQGVFKQHKEQRLHLSFTPNSEGIEFVMTFCFAPNSDEKGYLPEYRERMIAWQEQIRLLNKVKPYRIQKLVTFIKEKKNKGIKIQLLLPLLEADQ